LEEKEMYCPKCGEKLPDGSETCSACGAKLEKAAPEKKTAAAPPKAGPAEPIKKIGKKSIGILAAAVVIVLAAVLGLKTLSSKSGGHACLYLSSGTYQLLKDSAKSQAVEIASVGIGSGTPDSSIFNESTYPDLVTFSPDGKYVYYYTDCSFASGTLCRAEIGRLNKNPDKNDKYIEKIAANVFRGAKVLDDGSVLYENEKNSLYHYSGGEPVLIAKDVSDYYIDESGRMVYRALTSKKSYSLYGVSLADLENKTELAQGVYSIVDASDFDDILYRKQQGENSFALYTIGFDGGEKELEKDVHVLARSGGRTYFTAGDGTVSLYDFVEDDLAAADSVLTEPDPDDYSSPVYRYGMIISLRDLPEGYTGDLYTSCVHAPYLFYTSMENIVASGEIDGYIFGMYADAEKMYEATVDFVNRFGGSADEEGYILVTDEVKAGLQEICGHINQPQYYYWEQACFLKEQRGTQLDEEPYYAAVQAWQDAQTRNQTREILQNEANDRSVSTLYCYEDGNVTKVSGNVLEARTYGDAIVFNTTDLISEKPRLEDIGYDPYVVADLFQLNPQAENYIVPMTGSTVSQMSPRLAEEFAKECGGGNYAANASFYFTDKEAYLNGSDGSLFMAAITDGVIGDFTLLAEDARVLALDGPTLYYAAEIYKSSGGTYCDLCACTDGVSSSLAKDILYDTITFYSDGTILAYTGYTEYSGAELTMIDADGNASIVGNDVAQYVRADDSILLYVSGDNLYCRNGNKDEQVGESVIWFWVQNPMEITHMFRYGEESW